MNFPLSVATSFQHTVMEFSYRTLYVIPELAETTFSYHTRLLTTRVMKQDNDNQFCSPCPNFCLPSTLGIFSNSAGVYKEIKKKQMTIMLPVQSASLVVWFWIASLLLFLWECYFDICVCIFLVKSLCLYYVLFIIVRILVLLIPFSP